MHRLVPEHLAQMAADGQFVGRSTGAALVIDAEGSTELSASLQRFGTAGAEAQAQILKTVFSPMVDRVAAWGGFVSEFAGDGVVAVFLGDLDDTVHRAAMAADDVLRLLASLGELPTPAGSAALTVRCAVGAGSIEWRIWRAQDGRGRQNGAYTYYGSAVSEALAGESLAPGGAIVVGPTSAMHLDLRMSTEVGQGFRTVERTFDVERPPHPSNWSGPPSPLAFYPSTLENAPNTGEFRDVVSVFVELAEMPGVDGGSPMARLLQLLNHHQGYLCNVVPAALGDGARVFAFWGAPTSRERDIGYALRFLADLRSEVAASIRAGVTRSTVFAGFVGTPRHESYTCIGSGVNLAARMCSIAEWGEIRVDGEIRARLDEPWVLDALGPVTYRGFADPVPTHRVVHVPPVRRADPFRGAFVGRRSELDELEDLIAPLWSDRSAGVIAVVGEAGSGKSRLVGTLRERLETRTPPATWLEAQADQIRSQPLATLRDALAGYFGRPGEVESADRLEGFFNQLAVDAPLLSDEIKRSRRILGELLDLDDGYDGAVGDTIDPEVKFEVLVSAVESLVLAIEQSGPVVIYVIDGQWVDSGTAEILSRLQQDLSDRRIAVLIETRTAATPVPVDHLVKLEPLESAEISELAERLLGRPPDEELVEFVMDRSDGNIFYARQLLEYVKRTSLADNRLDLPGTDVPLDLRRVLVARLDELPAAVRRTVQVASVLGREIDMAVLAVMTEEPERVDVDAKTAVEARLWDLDDSGMSAKFRNLLVRDAAYGMLPHAEARILHESAARAIEQVHGSHERTAAELAFHYDRAGLASDAVAHYVIAAQAASSRYANAEAIDHLDRALALVGDDAPDRRFEILRLRFGVHDIVGDRNAQEFDLAAMEQMESTDPTIAAELSILRARLLSAHGSYAEAEEVVARALAAPDASLHVSDRASLAFLRAQLARHRGHNDRASSHAEEARSLYGEIGDASGVASVDDFLGGIAWDGGDFERAVSLHRSAADMFGSLRNVTDEIRALNNLGSALFALGDYSEARTMHEAGAARSADIGYLMGEGDHKDNAGGTAWAVGDYGVAMELYSAALAIRERMDDAWGIAISKGNLGATRRAMGYPDDALILYREALAIDRRIGRRRGEAYDLHGVGVCLLDLERYNLASEALGEAADLRTELGEHHLANESRAACATAMLRRGDVADAVALVDSVLEDEGDDMFEGAVETTVSLLRCIEVIDHVDPERATQLRRLTAERVAARAARISDPSHRRSYLESIEAHRTAAGIVGN